MPTLTRAPDTAELPRRASRYPGRMIRVKVDRPSITMGDDAVGHAVEWLCDDDVTLGEILRKTVDHGMFPANGTTPWLLLGVGRGFGGRPVPLLLLRLEDGVPRSVSALIGTTERPLVQMAPADADGSIPLWWQIATVDSAVPWEEFLDGGATVYQGWKHQQVALKRRRWGRR